MSDKKRILVAEDEAIHRKLLIKTLLGLGYEVECVHNGEEAIESLKNDPPPDLIVLDLVMPRKTGEDVLDYIKANMQDNKPLIFVLTNLDNPAHLQYCQDNGADLIKIKSSINVKEVTHYIEELLG